MSYARGGSSPLTRTQPSSIATRFFCILAQLSKEEDALLDVFIAEARLFRQYALGFLLNQRRFTVLESSVFTVIGVFCSKRFLIG